MKLPITLMILVCAPVLLGEEAVRVERLESNPIIRPEMLPPGEGDNINGPSLIRVPAWVEKPLGRYYLYFAHHGGKYIRLAFADRIEGPWKVHPGGVLHLRDVPAGRGHVASPDVHIDAEAREFRMYFHAPSAKEKGQKTFVAVSSDGLAFKARDEVLGIFYFRAFQWRGQWYALAKGGALYRSQDGLRRFEEGPNPFPEAAGHDPAKDPDHNRAGSIRHVAVDLRGDAMWVYYTRIGDAPEQIVRRRVTLHDDWRQWKAGAAEDVLRPEKDYEGVKLPISPSKSGAARGPEHAVRDPAIFRDEGRTWLIYSGAGETSLSAARVIEER